MRWSYALAAVTIVVLVCLSLFAGHALGDLRQVPMHWNLQGMPTSYAPKWIGLGLFPVVGLIALMNVLIAYRGGGENKLIRKILIVGLILILAHLYYMRLLMGYAMSLSL